MCEPTDLCYEEHLRSPRHETAPVSLTRRRLRGGNFMAYGSATVRPYVGAVKRVVLPIVSQAINPIGAPHFHRLPVAGLTDLGPLSGTP